MTLTSLHSHFAWRLLPAVGWAVGSILAGAGCGGALATPGGPSTTAGASSSTSVGGGGTAGGDAGASGVDSTGGPVAIDGVFNARHTGGLLGAAGRHVRDRVLMRSGHLAAITATGCAELQQLGIRSVIDLRETDGSTGVTANPDAACVTSTATYLHAELPKILPPSESSYLQTLTAAEPRLADIFARLSAPGGLPAAMHCVIGRDRASLVMAVVLLGAGVSTEDVVKDFTTNQDPQVQVQASWLQAAADYIDQQGGIGPYLAAHGVPADQIAALQQAALE